MRVLLITYHFPPDAAIGAVRPYQFARLLPQHGIETWVLTVAPEFAEARDDRLVIEGIPPERIIRTPVRSTMRVSLIKMASSWKTKMTHSQEGPETNNGQNSDSGHNGDNGWLQATPRRRLLLSWLYFPDNLGGWYRPALATAHQLLQQHKFDAVISTSPPRVAHFVAYQIANRYKLPWIMDLRDPWYKDIDEVHSRVLDNLYQRLFLMCANKADAIVMNTERLRLYETERVPGIKGKTITIPNGANPRPSATASAANQTPQFHIGHYGSVYSTRTTGTFLRGLRLWLDRHGATPPGLLVRFIGNEYGDATEYIEQLKLEAVVKLVPPVSRHEVYDLMSKDYILLLLANAQPLQVPGKLYEYFAANRRILATTEMEGAVADLMRDRSGCAIAENPEAVAAALDTFWQEFEQGSSADMDYEDALEEFSYENRTRSLAKVIKELKGVPAVQA